MRMWFFVRRRAESEPDASRFPFEVQLLDQSGGCAKYVRFGRHESPIMIEDYEVPKVVVERTRSLVHGQGDYLDEHANIVSPF